MKKKKKIRLIIEFVLLALFILFYVAIVFTVSAIDELYPYHEDEDMVKLMDKFKMCMYIFTAPAILAMMIIPTVIIQLREMRNKDYYYTIPNLQKRPEEPEDKIIIKEQEEPKE